MSKMLKRVLIALVILPILGFIVFSKSPYYFIGVAFFGILMATYEIYLMLEKKSIKTYKILGIIFSFFIILLITLKLNLIYYFFLITIFIIILFIRVIISKNIENLPAIFFTLAPIVYVTTLGSYGILLRYLENGIYYIFLLFLLTWVYDGGAYFTGTFFGKHKLIPELSPGKTIEGCIGGIFINVIVIIIIKNTVLPENLFSLSQLILLAILTSVTGQVGDISASILKRYTGVKNSSNLLSEHGGILDKIDSIIFNAPLLYFYIKFIVG